MGKADSKIYMCNLHCVFGSDVLRVSYLTLLNFVNGIFSFERLISEIQPCYCISLINVCAEVM